MDYVWALCCGRGERIVELFATPEDGIMWLRKSIRHMEPRFIEPIIPSYEGDDVVELTSMYYLTRCEVNPDPLRAGAGDGATA